jgi:hypothetical protein
VYLKRATTTSPSATNSPSSYCCDRNAFLTLPDESTATSRSLAYYRLGDGKTAVNDVMFDPDLTPVIGPLLGPPPGASS